MPKTLIRPGHPLVLRCTGESAYAAAVGHLVTSLGYHATELISGGRYAHYCSHYDFCIGEFGETYTDEVRAMMDSVDDNVITIAQSGNGTGKSHAAARIGVSFLKRYPDSQVYTAAAPPESNLKNILWGQIGDLVARFPMMFQNDTITTMHIERSALSFMTGVTIPTAGDPAQRKARFSGKHAPCILFILDEGDGIPQEVYEAIESCMSGGLIVRLLIMFNPKAESGPVNTMQKDGIGHTVILSGLTHINVVTGTPVFPGAVDRETTVRRINVWSTPVRPGERIGEDCFEVPPWLVGIAGRSLKPGVFYPPLPAGHRRVINPALDYMVLARYPAISENQLISRAWIADARSRWDLWVARFGERAPQGVQPILGLDIAESGVDLNALAPRYGGWLSPIMTWSEPDVLVTGDHAIEIYEDLNAAMCIVDSNGVGAGVPPHMRRHGAHNTYGIKVQSSPDERGQTDEDRELGEFKILRDQGYWAMRQWFQSGDAMIPPDDQLIRELLAPRYRTVLGKIRVTDGDTLKELLGGVSPDRMSALMLTFLKPVDIGAELFMGNYYDAGYNDARPTHVGLGM